TPFEADAGLKEPFPARIESTPTAAKDVRREAGRLQRDTDNPGAHGLIHKVAAIVADVDVSHDAEFAGEEIIHAHATTPVAIMTNIRLKQVGEFFLRMNVTREHIERELVGCIFWGGSVVEAKCGARPA